MDGEKQMKIQSTIASSTADSITVYGVDLCKDIIGQRDLTDMLILALQERLPSAEESEMVTAMVVSVVEHGLTPSAIAARLTYFGAPEALQGALVAGLLGAGSRVLGSMETAAATLADAKAKVDTEGLSVRAAAEALFRERRAAGQSLPGLGHPVHRGGDPRVETLFGIARRCGFHGTACELIVETAVVATEEGMRLPVNVTGAIAAIGVDMDLQPGILKGIGLVARCIGLLGHLREEMEHPIAWEIAREVEAASHLDCDD
jgi:citrate synthase